MNIDFITLTKDNIEKEHIWDQRKNLRDFHFMHII